MARALAGTRFSCSLNFDLISTCLSVFKARVGTSLRLTLFASEVCYRLLSADR